MSEERMDELIDELARDLEPVRPLPPIRSVTLGVLGIWGVVGAVGVALLGLRPNLLDMLLHERGVTAVFAALVAAGLSGLVAALALGVPGREGLARRALVLSGAAMALAAGVGTMLFAQSPMAEVGSSWTNDLRCLVTACLVAVLPALGVVFFAGRAAPHRPLVLVLAAAAGTAALGAATAQASCPYAGFRHLLVGHVLAPAAGALALTVPLLVALRRFASLRRG